MVIMVMKLTITASLVFILKQYSVHSWVSRYATIAKCVFPEII